MDSMNIETLLAEKNKYIKYVKKQLKVTEQDAEDIFSEALIKAWKNEDSILDIDRWMYTCIMFAGFNYKRAKIKQNTTTMQTMPDAVCHVTPEDILGCKNQCISLITKIKALPPQQQTAIKLWYIDDVDLTTACGIMKCGIDSAQTSRKLGLKKLRKSMIDMEQYTITKTWEMI